MMHGLLNGWRRRCLLGLLLTLLWTPLAFAHKASDAYLVLSVPTDVAKAAQPTVMLQLSIALRDVDVGVESVDRDQDRTLTWGEIRQAMPTILAWVGDGLRLRCAGQAVPATWALESLERRSDGTYLRVASQAACAPTEALTLDYRLLRDLDATHRLLIGGTLHGTPLAMVALPQSNDAVTLHRGSTSGTSGMATLLRFFPEGVHHIATGYDHLAFLLALLLPIMLKRAPSKLAATLPPPGLGALVRTVTGFTLGHSLTLALATFGWITAPGWVEPMIAITIGIAALLNFYPQRWLRSDALALGFGLIHGMGFASLMLEAQIAAPLLPWALAGFNLGVEVGQLLGVALWCGVHLVLVRWRHYERVVVRGGSWALFGLALMWTGQRLWVS